MPLRPLHRIAADILQEWGPLAHSSQSPYIRDCIPYVEAMHELTKISDMYGLDDAEDVVLRFLTNAASWRGEKARKIKNELNCHLKEKQK